MNLDHEQKAALASTAFILFSALVLVAKVILAG